MCVRAAIALNRYHQKDNGLTWIFIKCKVAAASALWKVWRSCLPKIYDNSPVCNGAIIHKWCAPGLKPVNTK